MYKDFSKKFHKLVGGAKSIVVTTHIDSDNDAIASLLAVYFLISEKYPGKHVEMVVATKPDKRLKYFANFEKIQLIERPADRIGEFDLAIFVDANYAERFNLTKEELKNYSGETICFDHHASKADDFSLILVEPEAAAASEVIYFALLEREKKINPRLCEILLMGLLSDTFRFEYVMPEQARVFDMAKRLVGDGNVSIEKLQAVYQGLSQAAFKTVQEFMANTRIEEIQGWPKFLVSYVGREFVKQNGLADLGVHEGKENFMGYLKDILGVPWGFALYPLKNGDVKVSFRATPDGPSVRKIAEGMGIGSGHDAASGGTFTPTAGKLMQPEKCVDKIFAWLKNNPMP